MTSLVRVPPVLRVEGADLVGKWRNDCNMHHIDSLPVAPLPQTKTVWCCSAHSLTDSRTPPQEESYRPSCTATASGGSKVVYLLEIRDEGNVVLSAGISVFSVRASGR